MNGLWREALLWLVLWLVCFGLGYPTLDRYDPRSTGGLSDARHYYKLVTIGPSAVPSHVGYRVLVPYLARPLARVTAGRIGTWEPVFFGLLVVNAFFTATTAYLLVLIGRRLLQDETTALLGAAVYLLNFETSNLRLSGLIDSVEGFFLIAFVWSLLRRDVWLLPVWGALGAVGKESFVPFSIVFTGVWWACSRHRERWTPRETFAILSTGIAALIATVAVQAMVSGRLGWPWSFAESLRADSGHLAALRENIIDRNLFYGFVWLLPLGLLRLGRLPRPWTLACAAATLIDLMLVAYYSAPSGAAARSIFSIAGPLLSLSMATLIVRQNSGVVERVDYGAVSRCV